MKALGLFNGRVIELDEKVLPIEDRGHQFGDGVYEVTEVRNGRPFALKHHLERLFRSLGELRIEAPYSYEELAGFHDRLIKDSDITEGGIYLQITRGAAPRTHNFPPNITPNLSMTIRPMPGPFDSLWTKGVKCLTMPDERWLLCHIKSLNLLNAVLATQKAMEAGCFEVFFVRNGYITESAHSNCFVVKNGEVWTHPANNLILKGVCRTLLIENLAGPLGIKVHETPFDVGFLRQADEAFLTATLMNVVPAVAIDGQPVGDGQVGPVTRKLQQALLAYRDQECGIV